MNQPTDKSCSLQFIFVSVRKESGSCDFVFLTNCVRRSASSKSLEKENVFIYLTRSLLTVPVSSISTFIIFAYLSACSPLLSSIIRWPGEHLSVGELSRLDNELCGFDEVETAQR